MQKSKLDFGTHFQLSAGAQYSCAVPPRIYYFYWVLRLCDCQTLQRPAPEKFSGALSKNRTCDSSLPRTCFTTRLLGHCPRIINRAFQIIKRLVIFNKMCQKLYIPRTAGDWRLCHPATFKTMRTKRRTHIFDRFGTNRFIAYHPAKPA